MATTHLIPTVAERPDSCSFYQGHFKSTARVLIEGSCNRPGFGIGGWDKTGEGRLICQGPMVVGPHAYAFQHAGIICQGGGTGAELRKAEEEGRLFRCKAGDTLVIDDTPFLLTLCRRGYPTLTAK